MCTLDYNKIWEEVIKKLEKTLEPEEFTWFKNIKYKNSKDNIINVSVFNSFSRDQLITRGYKNLIEENLTEISGEKIKLNIEISTDKTDKQKNKKPVSISPSPESTDEKDKTESHEISKTEIQADTKNETSFIKEARKKNPHPSLKPEYTFDNFVIGENNSFAANVAKSVAANPGKAYNPLLLYGGSGLGKTHLMEAIGNYAWENGDYKIVYITAEDFLNEFIEFLQVPLENKSSHKISNKMSEFKNKYRKADILLLDDIHFFQGKEGIQEELFHTFNALDQAGKQIVFTCDRPVNELSKFQDRLKSRCERGLNVDLQPPNFETRCAILRKKTSNQGMNISNDVISLIAENVSTNIRDLEGCLTKIIAYSNFKNTEITKDMAYHLLKDNFGSQPQKNITVEMIQKAVAQYFNISYIDLKGKKRNQSLVFPRHIAMYLCRNLTELSTTEIGIEFGGRDHTTVMHGSQIIEDRITAEPALEKSIMEITKSVKEPK